jgi:hypothetical protein
MRPAGSPSGSSRGFHLGPDERSAIDSARKWRPAQMPEVCNDDLDPLGSIRRMGAQVPAQLRGARA